MILWKAFIVLIWCALDEVCDADPFDQLVIRVSACTTHILQVRPLYMALYGGLYVDIDFVAVRQLDQLLQVQGPDANVSLGQDCGLQVDWSKSMRKQTCPDYAES